MILSAASRQALFQRCSQPIRRRFSSRVSALSELQVEQRVEALLRRERAALSRTVTLIESSRLEQKQDADRVMKRLMAQTAHRRFQAMRIGICGAPGAGKSSLIEKLGLHIVREQ